MAHRYERRIHEIEREEAAAKQLHWHNQINRDLIKNDLKPAGNMNVAINRAYENEIIGTKTCAKAHEIRLNGNEAKHKF